MTNLCVVSTERRDKIDTFYAKASALLWNATMRHYARQIHFYIKLSHKSLLHLGSVLYIVVGYILSLSRERMGIVKQSGIRLQFGYFYRKHKYVEDKECHYA